jgi:hypothetical protein
MDWHMSRDALSASGAHLVLGPSWALRRCFGAVVVISVHALANHGREGSLRDGSGRDRVDAGALSPQIGCERA